MDRIIRQLISLLNGAGLHCVKAFPQKRLPRLQSPMISVGLSEFKRVPAAIDSFVGTDLLEKSCFGWRETFSTRLNLYFPYAQGGEDSPAYIDRVLTVLAGGLSNLSVERMSVSPLTYDPDADCFRCTVTAVLSAVIYRQSTS